MAQSSPVLMAFTPVIYWEEVCENSLDSFLQSTHGLSRVFYYKPSGVICRWKKHDALNNSANSAEGKWIWDASISGEKGKIYFGLDMMTSSCHSISLPYISLLPFVGPTFKARSFHRNWKYICGYCSFERQYFCIGLLVILYNFNSQENI